MATLTRDPKAISKLITIANGKITCSEKSIIEFPKWYLDKELADEREVMSFYGIFAIIVGDKYSVSVIPTMCTSNPISTQEVERNGEIYLQLLFGKGDVIISNSTVVNSPLKAYNFIESYFLRANVPWYIDYETLSKCMDNLVKYGGSAVGESNIANELVTSFVARPKENKDIFYRQVGGKGPVTFVDLMNVYYSARSTVTKIAGSYFERGITSALVQKETEGTKLEQHMKG